MSERLSGKFEKTGIVVIDFGTTRGKVAYAVADGGPLPQIEYVSGYPRDYQCNAEVPMLLYYNTEDKTTDWGFEVKDNLGLPGHFIHEHDDYLVSRFKLLLDHSEATAEIRATLARKAEALQKVELIKRPEDFIHDFLSRWIAHVGEAT
jgi:hypothetical protein